MLEVVLVTGGWNNGAGDLYSTEMMVDFKAWIEAANLPSVREGPRAASLDNKVFLFGQQTLNVLCFTELNNSVYRRQ